ncbi:glycolate oxidase subunit GlcE [Granulosicoccus antarcticus]|uniref:Putative FAD-linked oxidoreductase n=1 Tax=Granulosicoccus antarcticus IMCC3135 TaxID=1192854 RepID=A0A2Z2NNZ4_9GAMM|nr:glycolate oxidase subunit GlcE [Granulosicoccus antarcticus]ASJ72963.1 putative FAD-linked oxidoreductase [Granulosicoccus antarcticus IMCC3135]
MTPNDDSSALLQRVKQAVDTASHLVIKAGNSKSSLGNAGSDANTAEPLSVLSHTGVISYEPTELVVTVRSGTTMQELNAVLDEAGQMLPFEPPCLPGSTIGGVLACGLSGPRRPFSGSARDYVLGTRIINGQAQDLSFGGQVMKNVAGYDVSRLQIGTWGTLGVLLDVSMKVLPKPELELTLVQAATEHDTRGFSPLMRQPLPLSAAMLIGEHRYLRLSGSEAAVMAAATELGGDRLSEEDAQIWQSVRDHEHEFFTSLAQDASLWRISVADHAPALTLPGEYLYEWAGAQRWLKTTAPAAEVFAAARAVGGHASRYSASLDDSAAFQPLDGVMKKLQSRVRDSFDPLRLFNRGRFHPELDAPENSQLTSSV